MTDKANYFNINKETWNKKVATHAQSAMYDLEAFKSGQNSLMSYELNALGDVTGKSMLHLQCHFGQDTLSWSRLGAKTLGIDFSDKAIALAKQLNEELSLDADFFCCNVLDTSKHVSKKFDIVFTSYGVIGWLPNLKPWAQMIAERLKPGGIFYMVEFHPILWMFDYSNGTPEMKYHYNQKEVIYEEYKGTYADQNSEMISKEYGWNHGLSEVINALVTSGLKIEYLNEYDESPYNIFPNLIKTQSGMYKIKNQLHPSIFEVKATQS
ncbi:class I SAM-dependent methyltransferase [Winogradskyella sp. DF17]|uniref:Class I SAM-dependent methyltransferase n=1 Tax=Winogradskyella pelagia TaxID=2819984 RepID=A0ABS3T0R9_9FLAO|nr:class I SAM-dependent methyltransferase [Winogradskyella sp. DF17]MBO3115854.1 class I SAM-dependent methyltransferase [Winogradskyella sp. DF17]